MKAVILAGGEGTRLRPLTSNQPKPMLPIANVPMMRHVVRLLAKYGFDDIVVTVAFLANQIRNYFGDGGEFGVRMRYATEDSPLGTAGSVRNAMDELDETFLVIAGDVITDIDLAAVVKAHTDREAFATIALKRVNNPVDFGIVITNDDGTIERFLEKPTWGEVFSDTINTGIYVLEPGVFDFIPAGEIVDFSGDVFPAVLDQGLRLFGTVVDGYWEDVGTLEAYRSAHEDVLSERVDLEIPGFKLRDGVWAGEGSDISPDARVEGPVLVGDNTRVEAGAELRPFTVLGSDVVVKSNASIERTVVHDHVYVGSSARLRGAVVGRASDLRRNVHLDEGVVIGNDCFIGDGASVNPQVKIYPFKSVEAGAAVTSSIVWETRGSRTLFGRRGVSGLANVDITSEVAVRLALAYGTSLPKGAVVTTSRDTSRTARALKRAIMAGLNLSGINVMDLELATAPLTRFQVRTERAQGGMTIRLASGDPDSVEIRFFDSHGADIDEGTQRKIERLLYREDFRRAFAGDIGEIIFPPRAMEYYTAALTRSVNIDAIAERRFKVVLDYSFGAAASVMPNVLAKIGAEVLSVNPYASTAYATEAAEDHGPRVERLGNLVRSSGSDLGVVFDADGETATFIDDRGEALTADRALIVLVTLVCRSRPGARLALPVSVSREAERVAEEYGATITWTKLSAAHIMEVAGRGDIDFAASQEGGFIWPDVIPAYDAVATLLHLLDLLVDADAKLSEISAQIPPTFVAHEEVPTPWDTKGAVMREIVERSKDEELVLVDGVKIIRPEGWVLVLPDPELPSTHVWAEGDTEREARRLVAVQAGRIAEITR
jgi:Nucleoside-diphosphate-sugar pyrophosphorylase involved in lipopolysaccharide biosynthesis/translation initiation factor 2B, gamma/epsilon subunits (eIF-2Bgamma/eIF-2Bepsilon)